MVNETSKNLSNLNNQRAGLLRFARNDKKAAFTLAEVLITLGIIGVVAAMTLPTLIQNHRAKALEAGFKKSYANLQNAYNLTKESLGGVNIGSTYTKYSSDSGYYNANTFYQEFYKNINVVKTVNFYPITNYTGTKVTTSNIGTDYPAATKILLDGSSVGVLVNAFQINVYVDTNGPYKGPNRYGFDIFKFVVSDNNDLIIPVRQTRKYTEMELQGIQYPDLQGLPCNKDSTQAANGMGCSYYAVINICPDDANKTYWNCLPQ